MDLVQIWPKSGWLDRVLQTSRMPGKKTRAPFKKGRNRAAVLTPTPLWWRVDILRSFQGSKDTNVENQRNQTDPTHSKRVWSNFGSAILTLRSKAPTSLPEILSTWNTYTFNLKYTSNMEHTSNMAYFQHGMHFQHVIYFQHDIHPTWNTSFLCTTHFLEQNSHQTVCSPLQGVHTRKVTKVLNGTQGVRL